MRASIACLVTLLAATDTRAGEIALFNGKDLSGWTFFLERQGPNAGGRMKMEDVWTVKDGVLRCAGVPNGYIRTTADYTSYRLRLEWRWPAEPTNSGVLLRLVGPDKVWPRSIEAQLMNGNAGDIWLVDGAKLAGDPAHADPKFANHFVRPHPAEKPPGQWNEYDITVDGGRVAMKVNGVPLNEGSGAEVLAGKIGLQSEGSPIEFRNIRLTPLDR